MTNQSRSPKGKPSGGQFGGTSHDEPDAALTDSGYPHLDGLDGDRAERFCDAYVAQSHAMYAHNDVEPGDLDGMGGEMISHRSPFTANAEQVLRNDAAEAWNGMPADLRTAMSAPDVSITEVGSAIALHRDAGVPDTEETDTDWRRLQEYAAGLGESGEFFLVEDPNGVPQIEYD